MSTFELEHEHGTNAVSSSPYGLDLGPVGQGIAELPRDPSVSPLDPLHDSRTARRETVNGQTGIFFEYHYPEIVTKKADGPIPVENLTPNLQQDHDSNSFGPRALVINGRAGLFYPDINLQQIIEPPGSSMNSLRGMDHLQLEGNGVIDCHPASLACTASETAFELRGLQTQIGGIESGRGSDPESIPEPKSDNNGNFLSNCRENTAPESIVGLSIVLGESSQVGSVQLDSTPEDDESDTISEVETEPAYSYGYAHNVLQPVGKASQASIRPHATVESGGDSEPIRGCVHDIAQVDLVLKRWNADPRRRSQAQRVTMFCTLPMQGDVDYYRHPTWFDLRSTFEKKIQFDSTKDMLFIDDVGATRPSHFDQILEERISAMASNYLSPPDGVNWVYKIGIIFVDLTDPKAFMTYVRYSNPYFGMGVPYARKSPKDLHLIPTWQGDFMNVHLDHDRTLLALVHGKHVTQISTFQSAPNPVPGTLVETDLLFVPPKNWAGRTKRESLKGLSLEVKRAADGGGPAETLMKGETFFLDQHNCKALVEAWGEPVSDEGSMIQKLKLAQALLG